MKIKFISLASGSSGNCYFIGTDAYGILVDAGIGIRTIKKHLKGTNLSIIDMLVTEDVRKDKETKWLNIIFKKVKI